MDIELADLSRLHPTETQAAPSPYSSPLKGEEFKTLADSAGTPLYDLKAH